MGADADVPAPRDRVARLLARLAHRFSDREAILWRGGLDEEQWSALESEVMTLLGSPRASTADLAAFARAYISARRELTHGAEQVVEAPPSSSPAPETVAAPPTIAAPMTFGPSTIAAPTTKAPSTPSSPHSIDEAAPTIPRPMRRPTLELGTPVDGGGAERYEVPIRRYGGTIEDPSTDEDPLSQTIHSPGRAPKSAPPSK